MIELFVLLCLCPGLFVIAVGLTYCNAFPGLRNQHVSVKPNPPLFRTLSHTARNMLRALITCCAILLALCAVAQVCSLPTPTVLTQVTGPVKVVVIPVCVASHWFQSLAIIKELSHRGHSLQVGRRYLCHAEVNLSVLCQSFSALQSPQARSVWDTMTHAETIAL